MLRLSVGILLCGLVVALAHPTIESDKWDEAEEHAESKATGREVEKAIEEPVKAHEGKFEKWVESESKSKGKVGFSGTCALYVNDAKKTAAQACKATSTQCATSDKDGVFSSMCDDQGICADPGMIVGQAGKFAGVASGSCVTLPEGTKVYCSPSSYDGGKTIPVDCPAAAAKGASPSVPSSTPPPPPTTPSGGTTVSGVKQTSALWHDGCVACTAYKPATQANGLYFGGSWCPGTSTCYSSTDLTKGDVAASVQCTLKCATKCAIGSKNAEQVGNPPKFTGWGGEAGSKGCMDVPNSGAAHLGASISAMIVVAMAMVMMR